eukprot:PhM_4_TR2430/c6_g2_i5/m.78590
MDCQGCEDFACVGSFMSIRELCVGDDDTAVRWLVSHRLVYQTLSCARSHDAVQCHPPTQDKKYWECPIRACRRRTSHIAPLLDNFGRMSPLSVLMVIYCHIEGLQRKTAKRETKCTQKSVAGVIERLERLLAIAHQERYRRARWSVFNMQKDETCFSKIKRGGCNRNRRVRQQGSTWAHVLVETTPECKAIKVFVLPLPDRTAETMVAHVTHLIASRLANVWTDSFRSNWPLHQFVRWKAVNHRREWVTPAGVHTNTVEGINSMLKRALKLRGGTLGKGNEIRENRMRYLAESSMRSSAAMSTKGSSPHCAISRASMG